MRIVVNGLSVHLGGGLVGLQELLRAFVETDPGNEYVLIVAANQNSILENIPAGIAKHVVNVNSRNVIVRILFEQLLLPVILWRLGADWLYSLGNQTVLLAPCKTLVLIENANPYSRHLGVWNMHERARLFVLRMLGRLSCWRATRVRFLTEHSFRALGDRLGVRRRKACIIPHGVNVHPLFIRKGTVNDPLTLVPEHFVFTACNVAPHKNIHTLMKGFDLFVQQSGYEGALVIAGAFLSREYVDRLQALQKSLQSGGRIIFLGWVDPGQLGYLYTHADVFVFPSIEETFGLPLIEAMAYGVPVVASRVNEDRDQASVPFQEICGPAALYFNAFDPQDLAAQMRCLISDRELRENIIRAGKDRSEDFSWNMVAARLSNEFHGAKEIA